MTQTAPQTPTPTNLPQPWDAARENASKTANKIKPIEKAAIILAAIGPEIASSFLRNMDEKNLTRCAMAISRLTRVSEDQLDATIAEFLLSIGTDEEVLGGTETARRLLSEVLDDGTIERIMYDVEGGDIQGAWKKLNDVSVPALATFIASEHPQTAAVIMSELRADKAAGVIERLDPEFAHQTILRLSSVPVLDSIVSDKVERVIAKDFLSAIQGRKKSRKPADLIAGVMNNLTSATREKFIGQLEEAKPTLAKEVLKVMFTFADIRHRVEPRDVAVITKEIPEGTVTTALKYATDQRIGSAEFILSNIPKRLSERLTDDIANMGDITPRDGETSMQEVVRAIQELAKAGTINLIEEEFPEDG